MGEDRFLQDQVFSSQNTGALDGYIPIDRRIELTQNTSLAPQQWGAVLFADISSFTELTNIFSAEQGAQMGAEELTFHLNRIYGPLIDIVHQYQGEVIGFAGDSITCWFPADTGLLSISSALSMQQFIAKTNTILTPKNKIIRLEIKISIVTGQCHRFLAGDPNIQYIEVLAGNLLNKIFVANNLARPGEIIVTEQVSITLGGQLEIKEWKEDPQFGLFGVAGELHTDKVPKQWPSVSYVPAEWAKNWIPVPVYKRLINGQENYLAELRWSVPLFIKFGDLDFDTDKEAPQKLDAFIQYVQTVLNRYGGHLLQLVLGDKGSYIYAIFGALVSNENDPVRAVSAAQEIVNLPATLQYISSVQTGISSGLMYSGIYGSQTRHFYSACGGETNIAARLMELAQPGQILVSKQVKKDAEAEFDFRAFKEPVQLKGISQPIPVFELVQNQKSPEKKAYFPDKNLIGRTEEQSFLFDNLQKLRQGKSSIVVLEAEAGMGKSRLMNKLREKAEEMNIACLPGAGDDIERSTIYYAWRSIFANIMDLGQRTQISDEDKSNIERSLQLLNLTSVNEEISPESHLALLTSILPVDFPDTPQVSAMTAQARAEATRQLLLHLLKHTYRDRPLLLLIDDVQWLDSASWALIHDVINQREQLFVVLATRPMLESPVPEFQALLQRADVRLLQLKPMDNQDIIQLIAQRLGVNEIPPLAADFILGKAEGNPFFGEELAYALLDNEVLFIQDGSCKINPDISLPQLNFPNTIQELITTRIDRLEPPQQLVLKVASVIGRNFALQTLQEVFPESKMIPNLHSDLDLLTRLDFTLPDLLPADLSYLFKHIITQQVAYNLLLHAQRRQLHYKIAEWCEQKFANDLSPYFPLLAHHWLKAVEGTGGAALQHDAFLKAVAYAEQAGLHAIRNNANAEAISILSHALSVLKSFPERGDLNEQELRLQVLLAIPLTLTGGWASDRVGEAYNRAHELCIQIGKTPQLFPTLVGVFTYYLVRAQYQKAATLAKDNLDLALSANEPALIMEAEHDQGAVLFYTGNIPSAQPHFNQCTALYDAEKHYPHVFIYGKNAGVTARVHLSLIYSVQGCPDKAEKIIQEGIEMTKYYQHPFSYAWALSGKSVIHQMYNRVTEMKPVVQALISESQEQGFPNWLAQGLTWQGWIQLSEGAQKEAIQNMQKGVGLWQMTGSELLLPYLMYLLADGYSRTGEQEQAIATLEQAIEKAERNGEMWFTAEMWRLRGQLHLLENVPDMEKAESLYLKGLALAEQQEAKLHQLRLATSLARLWDEQGKKRDAYELLLPKYRQFTEGHSTPLLQETKTFLDALNGEHLLNEQF